MSNTSKLLVALACGFLATSCGDSAADDPAGGAGGAQPGGDAGVGGALGGGGGAGVGGADAGSDSGGAGGSGLGDACKAGKVSEGDDYATAVWQAPWDFATMPDALSAAQLGDVQVGGGALGGTILDVGDGQFFLMQPPIGLSIELHSGGTRPIDPARYHRVAFRLCTSAVHFGESVFTYAYDNAEKPPKRTPDIWVHEGCDVYVRELAGDASWSDPVRGLRFNFGWVATPGDMVTNPTFSLDWFRVTASPDPQATLELSWHDLPGEGSLDLYLDTDEAGEDGAFLLKVPAAKPSGEVTWGADVDCPTPDQCPRLPQDFQPGLYHLHAKLNGASVGYLGAITIKAAPRFTFDDPSFESGPDYATDQGDPWDMDDSGLDGTCDPSSTCTFNGGHVQGHGTGGDP